MSMVMLLGVVPGAQSQPPGVAENMRAFNTALPSISPDGRIAPFVAGQEYCSDQTLGVWVYFADVSTEDFETFDVKSVWYSVIMGSN